ncbi:ferrous iron transport protein A [Corynebacterium hansenii]|uniref:Ferrous iron transport protein A n=1 Tax=Corynebacterium hansenii TaxID=394964 RepID=A0ABV7ZS81_9CORY|nr:ferrous iron transport protein A [Corynebacterium hansenii]WJY99815.1 FeoA domain protein [Corynebacterium hansenii]
MAIRLSGLKARGARARVSETEPIVTEPPTPDRLCDVAVGDTVVLSAPRTEPRLCRRLAQLGLRPGMSVTVGPKTAGGGRVIKSGTSRYAIDRATLELMDVLR